MNAGGCAGFIGVELLGLAVVAVIGIAFLLAKRLLKNNLNNFNKKKHFKTKCFFVLFKH